MAVTIRDVAREAGVSISTVSRALANPEQVAEATRTLVQQTARAMGYRPNRAARGLITGKTGSIGLVVPDLENPFFGRISKGVQARARQAGYAVYIADTDEDPSVEAELVHGLIKQVDGVVLCSARGTDDEIRSLAAESPLVLVNRRLPEVPSITFDNAGAVEAVLRHLVALGHREIAYAGGPLTSWSNRERAAALRSFCDASPDLTMIELGNFPPYFSGGVHAADLAVASGVTAVVAFNDLVAVGLLDRLRRRGIRVPEDMSVTGFDNVPASTLVWPNLTTVDFPRMSMGRMSVDALLDIVFGRDPLPDAIREVPIELIVRESTGVARGAGTPVPRAPEATAQAPTA